jgi:hypothetical protein
VSRNKFEENLCGNKTWCCIKTVFCVKYNIMQFKKTIEYVHGSYKGFLNGYLATSILDTKEDVIKQLNILEELLKEYDPEIVKSFFLKDKKLIEKFLTEPDNLKFSLDLKKNGEGEKIFKQTFKDFYKR